MGYSRLQPPNLSVEGTDIPGLRRHLYTLPSHAKFVALEHHCKTSLKSVPNILEMVCSVSKLKRREDLDKIVADTAKVHTPVRLPLTGDSQSTQIS